MVMATTSSVVISRFVKLDELASGACGIVYCARDRRSRSTLRSPDFNSESEYVCILHAST
uniref:Uncharacterized protein n=1 Tax=Oryza punctata TaxID=4537 RepID=A0A0E0MLW6_ORYPU